MRFRNTLLRDAAYEGLPFRRRRELHTRVAATIESSSGTPEDEASTLALHYSEAHNRDRTWHYARIAGDRAKAIAANVEAARFYDLALQAARYMRGISGRERADVLVSLASACESGGMFERAYRALCRATLLVADDPVAQARLFAERTRPQGRLGAYSLALRDTAFGLRLVEGREDDPAVGARALLLSMRSEIRWVQGRPRDAIVLAEAAIAEAERVGELRALSRAYGALDTAWEMLGQPEKAVNGPRMLALCTELGDVRLRGIIEVNLGVSAYAQGRWQEAVDFYVRAQEDSNVVGDRFHGAYAAANLGEVLISAGEYEQAEQALTEARRVGRSMGFLPLALWTETQLGRLELERGDAERALSLLERVLDECSQVTYAAVVLEASVWFAHAHARAGSPATGLKALEEAVEGAGAEAVQVSAAVDRARAACFAALGQTDSAREMLDRALEAALDQDFLYEQLLVRRARLELGVGADVEEELRERDRLAQLLRLAT
jgi:tetratricopeptide (TPR) repeat protein